MHAYLPHTCVISLVHHLPVVWDIEIKETEKDVG